MRRIDFSRLVVVADGTLLECSRYEVVDAPRELGEAVRAGYDPGSWKGFAVYPVSRRKFRKAWMRAALRDRLRRRAYKNAFPKRSIAPIPASPPDYFAAASERRRRRWAVDSVFAVQDVTRADGENLAHAWRERIHGLGFSGC